MSYTHSEVCDYFAHRMGTTRRRGHSVFTNSDNTTIYSWGEHFALAHAIDDRKLIIINGDRNSVSTSRHQSELRGALTTYLPKDYKQITIPFDIARQARIDIFTVEEIDVEQDYERAICTTHNVRFDGNEWTSAWQELQNHVRANEDCKTEYEHHLGGSIFRAKGDYRSKSKTWKYFLSGFDSTHNSRSDGYFISLLPHAVKSVEEGFISLQPKQVKEAIAAGLDVKRQGDCFAIPAPEFNSRRATKQRAHKEPVGAHRYVGRTTGKAYTSEEWYNWRRNREDEEADWKYVEGAFNRIEVPSVGRSHGANEVAIDRRGRIYARGNLIHIPNRWNREPEHKRIPLGKVWHRILFNTALASWQPTTGRVD